MKALDLSLVLLPYIYEDLGDDYHHAIIAVTDSLHSKISFNLLALSPSECDWLSSAKSILDVFKFKTNIKLRHAKKTKIKFTPPMILMLKIQLIKPFKFMTMKHISLQLVKRSFI